MPSRSSEVRTRRAVLAVVIVGSLASIATSKVKQRVAAPIPATTVAAGGAPATLQIRAAAAARGTASLTADVRVKETLAPGTVKLRFEYVRADGTPGELHVSELTPGHWRLYSHVWRGCTQASCADELTLRIQADQVGPDGPATITVDGTVEVSLPADSVEGPIQITVAPAP